MNESHYLDFFFTYHVTLPYAKKRKSKLSFYLKKRLIVQREYTHSGKPMFIVVSIVLIWPW